MNLKQGDFENILLNALWDLEEQGTCNIDVQKIQEFINSCNTPRAYTTVKTVLDRLVMKEMIARVKLKKKYFYHSKISRIEAGKIAVEKIAEQYFKGQIKDLVKTAEKMCLEDLVMSK